MRRGRGVLALIVAIGVVAGVVAVALFVWPDGGRPGARRNGSMPTVSPPPPGSARVVAAGDICYPSPDSCAGPCCK